ncbi:Protein Mis18-beta [Collichthys lucidus]|uniref:Protein Mis18-beta n=1 Tax=Collichthys lucidus TaxID=240159 RepID=A0A4U5VFT1_COLLU|nr:Protein Mis18-beta [Collichthys lucidus]
MEFNGSILVRRRVDVETDTELQPNQLATLHCWQCSVILGDSLDVCGEMKQLDLIICLKVTHDVAVSEARAVSRGGQMANCIYSPLKCRRCHSALGRIIRAAPPHLTAVRNKFLLYKPNIGCYILKSSSVVTARAVTFATKTCKESMNEPRRGGEAPLVPFSSSTPSSPCYYELTEEL